MNRSRQRFSRAVTLLAFALVVPALPLSSAVDPSSAATPGSKPLASHWAGSFNQHAAVPLRIERAGGPGVLSRIVSRERLELQNAAGPGITPSSGSDGEWSLLAGTGESSYGPSRVTHSAIYDPTRDRYVIFGGSSGQYLDDTWVHPSSGSAWTPLQTQGGPPAPRRLHRAVYDAQHDRMIVFGGYDGSFLNDVWALSFQGGTATWSQLTPAGNAPPGRAGHAMVYDADDDRLIVFAGYDGASAPDFRLGDVWALSLGGNPTWSDITPAGQGPSARSSVAAAYDSQRDRMIIVGGTDPSFLDDAWALDLDGTPAWSAIAASTRPAAREEHSLIYDAAGDRLVLFGGYDAGYYYGDTWALPLSGPPAWSALDPAGLGPGPRWGHIAAYDSDTRRMLVFGGYTGYGLQGQTYVLSLSGLAWTNPTNSPGPGPVRHTFASTYDSRRHRFVLVGGSSYFAYENNVWVIGLDDDPSWSLLATQGTPPGPRRLAECIYDQVGDRVILYGGWDDTILGDLWELSFATDPPTWSPLAASGATPPARAGHAVVYDLVGHRMIVFGGFDGVSANYRLNDVWALNLGNDPSWEQLSPLGPAPSPRSSMSAVYDRRRHEMVVFGGTTPTFKNETWTLSLGATPAWTRLVPAGPLPTPREEQSAMYDLVRDRLVIFGGYIDPYFTSTQDTWALALGNDPAWTQLSPAGPQPSNRWGQAAVYDLSRDRMVMHGGLGSGMDQTWALTWGHPAALEPTLVSSEAKAGQVQVIWAVDGGAYFTASVYRSVNEGGWTDVGEVPVDAAGQAVYEDNTVAPGTRYGYRVGVQAGAGEKLSLPTYLDTPGTTGVADAPAVLAILGSRPAGAELAVRVSLASDAPAHLTLLDVSGRTIAARNLGALGAGAHQVSLAGRSGLAPGIYWLRLAQGGRMVGAKAAMWR